MKLFYKGEFIKNISGEESKRIYNYKGVQVMVDGELLKKSQLEIRKDEAENKDKIISNYSTEELKAIIGDFEKEYNSSATGKVVRNEMLGHIKEGTIEHALRFGAITKKERNGNYIFYIKLPEYNQYQEKFNALRELCLRREYAIKKLAENNN